MKYSDIEERVDNLLKSKGIKPTNIAIGKLAGVSDTTVSNWKSGRRSPSLSNLTSLARGLEVTISMLLSSKIEHTLDGSQSVNEPTYAYAGSSGDYQTARVVEESWNYVKREVQKNNPMKIFRVVGDSMAPTLYDTDMVFAIPEASIDDIRQTYIYVVHSNRHKNLLIKRVVNRGDGTLLLSSDNKEHKNFIINIEDIGGLWRVRAYLSWQMGAPVLNADRLLLLEDRLSKLEGKL